METRVSEQFQPLPLEAQADLMVELGLDTLLFCPDPWALQHRFIDTASGLTVRARCGSWTCLYCGRARWITMDTYSHVLPNIQKDAMGGLGDFFE